jgi:hypothetical protein
MKTNETKQFLDDIFEEDEQLIAFFFSKSHFDDLGIDISDEQWDSIVEQAEDVNLSDVVKQIEEIIQDET